MQEKPNDSSYRPRRSSLRQPWRMPEFKQIFAHMQKSGLTLQAYARLYGLCPRQMSWWRQKLAAEKVSQSLVFVPVVAARPAPRADTGVELAIGAAVVRLTHDFCEQTLARVVAVLAGASC